jgi:hypothetical protein
MPLTDVEVRTAKAGARLAKLSDGGGPQLCITTARNAGVSPKGWRIKLCPSVKLGNRVARRKGLVVGLCA